MSRDSSGTYTLPLPDVVAGDTIEATWANTSFADFETELTDSLSRSGKGGMTAALKIAAGTVSAPGIAFSSETNTGFYRAAAGDMRIALAGAEFLRITSAGMRIASTDLIVGTAGKGIDFAVQTPTAATGATTTAEILNHYEVGTWTPNLWDTSLSSSESQTYSSQSGTFTRIGNVVYFIGTMVVTSVGTLTTSSQAKVGPLPYTSASSPALIIHNGSHGSTVLAGLQNQSTNYLTLSSATDLSSGWAISQITTGLTISFSGFYFV